ncbi:MAG: CDP-alcohol phosphatidyltransferase family protein [Candidatus Binataceae bacterium]
MLDTILGDSADVRRIQSTLARALFRVGVGANLATALAAVTGVAAGIAFGKGSAGWGIALLALSAALDALDGTIARQCAAPSALGGIFDLVSDRIVETAVIIGIAWGHAELYFAALLLVGSWYVNITVFLAVGAALDRHGPKLIEYPPGILERTEALAFFVILASVESIRFLHPVGPILCYAMAALELVTGAQRLIFGWRKLRAGSSAQ